MSSARISLDDLEREEGSKGGVLGECRRMQTSQLHQMKPTDEKREDGRKGIRAHLRSCLALPSLWLLGLSDGPLTPRRHAGELGKRDEKKCT